MSEQELARVVRPARKIRDGLDPFSWVHLDDGHGEPLCGEQYGDQYVKQLEIIGWGNLGRAKKGKTTLCRKCAQKHFGFEVQTIQHGQARAYQDSKYIYDVTDVADEPRDREEVLEFCRRWVCFFYDRADMPHAFAPRLCGFRETKSRVWRYHVERLFTG